MKPKSKLRSFLLLAGSSLLAISHSPGATYYWDNNTTTAGFGTAGGTWTAPTVSQWTASVGGTATPVASLTTATTDSLNFGNGSTATGLGAGTVTVSGPVDAGNLIFASGSGAIVLSTGGTINLAAASTITVNNAASTISSVLQGAATSLTKAGTGTLTLNGAANTYSGSTLLNGGALALSGDTATITGTSGITFNSGGLTLTNTNSTQTALDRVPNVGITSNGGTLTLANTAGANLNYAETIGSVALTTGQLNLVLSANQNNATNNSQLLALSGLTRSANTSAVTFSALTTGPQASGGDNIIRVNGITTSTPAGQIVGPWATLGTAANAQNDYAIYNSDATDGYVVPAAIAAGAETTWTTAANTYTADDGLGGVTLSGTRNITALKSISTAIAVTPDHTNDLISLTNHTFVDGDAVVFNSATTTPAGLSLGTVYFVRDAVALTSFKLAATQGGTAIDFTTNGTAVTAVGALLTSTGNNLGTTGILNASGNTMYVGTTGTGAVTLPSTTADNLHVTAGVGPIVISAPVTDNTATGVLTLVKNGSANLTLSGNNTFTGGIVNNSGGTTTLSGTNTFGSGAVTINGGLVTFSTLASWGGTGRNVTFGGVGTLTSTVDGYSGGTLALNTGAVATITSGSTSFSSTTGSGTLIASATVQNKLLNIGNAGSFNGTLQGRHSVNSTNGTNVTLQFSGLGDAAGSALQFQMNVGGNNDSNQAYTIAYNGTSALTFDNRQVQILDRLSGNWEIRDNILANNSASAAHPWVINTDLLYLGGRANTGAQTGRNFILSGSNTGDNAFNGKITDGVVVGTAFNVAKTGLGKWILSGDNTYTGTTSISGGVASTLVANGATALGVGGNITFSGNGTLQYTANSAGTDWSTRFKNSAFGIGIDTAGQNVTLAGVIDSSNVNGIFKYGTGSLILSGSNTYTGTTTIDQGALVIAANAPVSLAGALGNSNTEVALGTAGSGSFAQLHTNGAFTVDRAIRLRTSNTTDAGTRVLTIGGTTAHDSVFTGNIFLGTINQTSKGIRLTAAAGGKATFSGVIQNPSGQDAAETATAAALTAVTKIDAGTVVLSNSNTYTGSTAINAGTLTITGATQATTGITVGASGSLGLDIAGTVAASSAVVTLGGTVTVTGPPTLSSYTLLTASSIGGTPVLSPAIPGYTLAVDGGNTLKLNSTGGPVGYAAWQAANGTGGARGDDHDNDGVDNGTEHFLGGTAVTTGFTALPSVVDTAGTLSVTWTKAGTYTGTYSTDFVVETSDTLIGAWTPEIASPNLGFTVTFPSATEVKYTFPNPLGTKKFARLKVTGP